MDQGFRLYTDAELRAQLKTEPQRGYLLFGDEDYLKTAAISYAKETVGGDAAFACFNQLQLDALTYTPEALSSALQPPPMMADRKLIVLRGVDVRAMRARELDALCEALSEQQEYDYNVVLLSVPAGCLDEGRLPKKPSAVLKRLAEYLCPVRYERCSPAKLNGWCIRHFRHNGVDAQPALCHQLIQVCGTSMYTLACEIDKISYYVLSRGRTQVEEADISMVACAQIEYDAYAFTNALMERNTPRALAILADLKFRQTEPLLILSEVTLLCCNLLSTQQMLAQGKTTKEIATRLKKVHEFQVELYARSIRALSEQQLRDALAACLEADRSMKQNSMGYVALERLICSL